MLKLVYYIQQNNKGKEYFKVYSTDGVHNQIGITEDGLDYINKHAYEISEIAI